MATTKNITMKQFNGTDYDILYPKTVYNQVSGVAPAGYGLGETISNASIKSREALDATIKGGIYYYYSDETATGFSYSQYSMIVVVPIQRVIRQYCFPAQTNMCWWVRQKTNNADTWGPWEWGKVPMVLGAEYRTTERYQGKPVYVKLVDFGALPNTASKYVDPNISNFEKLIEPMTVTFYNSDGSVHSSPLLSDTDIVARSWFMMASGGIAIKTMTNQTSDSAVVKLKYTKTTD